MKEPFSAWLKRMRKQRIAIEKELQQERTKVLAKSFLGK
jgi:hypothetical protein